MESSLFFVEMMRQMASSGQTLDSCEGVLAFLMLAKVFLLANGCCSGLEMLRNSQKLSFPWQGSCLHQSSLLTSSGFCPSTNKTEGKVFYALF
jgi:hypothetical protein